MVVYDGSRTAAENAQKMREAVATVATGEVTIASRDVQMAALRSGKATGSVSPTASPSPAEASFDEVAYAVVERLLSEPRELLTLLVGRDGAELEGILGRIAQEHPAVDVDVQEGGQPHYHLLLAAE